MIYDCVRCKSAGTKNHGEYRKGAKTGQRRARYLVLEKAIQESKIARLQKTWGQRRLCLACLEELAKWLPAKVG
jgi:hypothetical protein